MVDTVPGSSATTTSLSLASPVNGLLDTVGDHDWYRVTLVAGQTYSITVDSAADALTDTPLVDSYLRLRSSSGTVVIAEDDDGGQGLMSQIIFTAPSTGTYYVDVGGFGDTEVGNFRVNLAYGQSFGLDSVAGYSGTTTTLAFGSSRTGRINELGDQDWYAVTLTAGQSYIFKTEASGLSGGDVDTFLSIRRATGPALAENDDSAGGIYSSFSFTPTTSGTYYLAVSAFGNNATGNFRVSAAEAPTLTTYTYDQIADQLIYTYWGGPNSARKFDVGPGGAITVNLTGAASQTLAREALALWTDVTGIRFNEVTSGGQIVFSSAGSGALAETSTSRIGGNITSATVTITAQWLTDYGNTVDSYSFQTFIHEIGHALGLGHAGDYNSTATYPSNASYQNDSVATSIMSYFSQTENTYFNNLGFSNLDVITPMNGDIVALQRLYGVNTSTRTGDTIYGVGNSSGRTVYSSTNAAAAAFTVIDNGGIDTLNYSSFTANQRIDLNQETFSNIGGRTGNMMIARGTVIENALSGSGSDTLIGNAVANLLNGGAGADTLNGGAGDDVLIGGAGADVLDGGAGRDVASFAGAAAGMTINLATLAASTGDAAGDNYANIEAFVLTAFNDTFVSGAGGMFVEAGAGNDSLTGGDGVDSMNGGVGNDTFTGGAGDDRIIAGTGRDIADGGAGTDTLQLAGRAHAYSLLQNGGQTWLVSAAETVRYTGFEQFAFAASTVTAANLATTLRSFNAMSYIASHGDLIGLFGSNADAGASHFANYGAQEGRTIAFNTMAYLASHRDLITFFGADETAGAKHFIEYGRGEGRGITFDSLAYIASHADLSALFGSDAYAGAKHFVEYGSREGRAATFDVRSYLAANTDLGALFGSNLTAAAQHYIDYGRAEGRSTTFNVWGYLAGHADVRQAFGTNLAAATQHFLDYGRAEGRSTTAFDALAYGAGHLDLARAFGDNPGALARHYVEYGAGEGRAANLGFDAEAYLLTYGDLQSAGLGRDGALHHWLQYGAREGRAGDSFFGREQPSHSLTSTPVNQGINSAGDHDWFQFATTGPRNITLTADSSVLNFRLELHNAAGQLLSTGTFNQALHDSTLTYHINTAGDYFVAIVPLDTTTGNYTLTMFG